VQFPYPLLIIKGEKMAYFKLLHKPYYQAIQLTDRITVKTNKAKLVGIVGDWLVIGGTGEVNILSNLDFWNLFTPMEEEED
jgi:hypothetical protein